MYGRPRLAELLTELNKVDGLQWIRLLYAYPEHFGDDLIEVLATSDRIVPYLDMPLQHINDNVLRRMVRRVDRNKTVDLLDKLRERVPGLAIRTTFISGFPGETAGGPRRTQAVPRRRPVRAVRRVSLLASSRTPPPPSSTATCPKT